MLSNKFAILALFAAIVVSAAPGKPAAPAPKPKPPTPPTFPSPVGTNTFNKTTKKCNTGVLKCCNSVQTAQQASQDPLSGVVGLVLPNVAGLIGANCNNIGVLAIQGNSCTSTPVCCNKNKFKGLVNVGCTPINANL